MASTQTARTKFLTLVVLFIVCISLVLGDLAPKEDEDEEVKPPTDLKKIEEVVTTLEPPKTASNLGFIHAFIASFSVIMVSEIGDKTFFIAAIMSMVRQHHKSQSVSALDKTFAILEISSIDCFCGCNSCSCPYDRLICSVWNGFHSIHSHTYNEMGVRPFVRSVWTEDVTRRVEHDSHWCSWRNGRSPTRHQKERGRGKHSFKVAT